MRTVSRFEANLLRILYCFLRRAPLEQALPLIMRRCELPRCLSRAAVELVQDALGKGCPWLLARGGGWRRERHLRGERIADGRLWERSIPEELGLTFSRHTLGFLLWLTAGQPTDKHWKWLPRAEELTLGDRLLFFFAYEALRGTPVAGSLRGQQTFAEHGLCRLAFPEDFADHPEAAVPNLGTWTVGQGASILEALQSHLAECWVEGERGKRRITDGRRMRVLGQAQEHVLHAFFEAVEGAGRRDLARFLLAVAAALLKDDPTSDAWVGSLDLQGLRLAERTDTYRAALVLLRQLERLQRWEREARAVGYFDEGYAAGQLWKADWERWEGEALYGRGQALIRQLEPLKT